MWEICAARDALCIAICTARKLSGITLLVPPLASQLVEISANVIMRPLSMLKRPYAALWETFMVDHHFSLAPVSLLFWECWFPQFHQIQYGTFVLITLSCEPPLYANYPPKPMWQSCQSIPSLKILKILINCYVLGLLRMKCRESLECSKVPYTNSYTVFVRAAV